MRFEDISYIVQGHPALNWQHQYQNACLLFNMMLNMSLVFSAQKLLVISTWSSAGDTI